jgi:hypothetical protein
VSERVAPLAALVAAVVLAGTVAGGLVAVAVADGGDDRPDDGDVVAALRTRTGLDRDGAGCVLGRLVVADALDDDLRRRLVDAVDPVDDVAALDAAVEACGGRTSAASPSSTSSTTAGPLPDCTGAAVGDDAAVEVCAVDALVGVLTAGGDLDPQVAACAAAAVVDELGVDAVLAALATGVPPADLRARLQTAFAAC